MHEKCQIANNAWKKISTGGYNAQYFFKSTRNLLTIVNYSELFCIQLFLISETIAYQAPLSMNFSKQEFWSEMRFTPPRIFPTHISFGSCLCMWILYHSATWEAQCVIRGFFKKKTILERYHLWVVKNIKYWTEKIW